MTFIIISGKQTYYTGSSAVESEDSVKYFHYNHRGDTVLVTDANGEILHNLNYEAYGKPTNSEGIPINPLSLTNATDPNNNTYSTGNTTGSSGNNLPNLFVGASGIRYYTKTNLHYMRFRWFSGEQMRFISADLLMDLNRYAYLSGDPINNIDPMGLSGIAIFFGSGFKASYGPIFPTNISIPNIQFAIGFDAVIFTDLLFSGKFPLRIYPYSHPLSKEQDKPCSNAGFNIELSTLYAGIGIPRHDIPPVLMIALIDPPMIALMDPLFIFHSFTKNPCILLLNILSLSSCFPPFHCLPCRDLFPGEGRPSVSI